MLGHAGLTAPADEHLAERIGRAIGDELAALAIDIDFAPELALSPQQGVANLVLRGTRR